MRKNMGATDRTVRSVLALLVVAGILTGVLHGVLAVVLGILAAAFVVTSLLGYCPLYAPFGFTTCRRKESRPRS